MGSWTVHTSNRLDVLIAALAERIDAEPLPPLQVETILVPSRGIGRYVELEIAKRHGIAASLSLPFPGAWLQSLCGEVSLQAPFDRSALVFRIFRLLGDPALSPQLGAAAAYCRRDDDQQKRLQLASALAQCFDDYQLFRHDWLAQFERGDYPDLLHADWQMRLFRALLHECQDQGTRAAAHRLGNVRTLLLDAGRSGRMLPQRLSVFGVASMPKAFLDLLHEIGKRIDVTVYATKPTEHFFGDLRRQRGGGERPPGSGPVLLEALGAASREFHDQLQDVAGDVDAEQPLDFVDPLTDSLLHTLQSDVLHLRDRREQGDAPPLPLRPDEASLRVHAAHGPLREMEILRDQLLAAFAELPELKPSEVLVLLPDVQAYAPYVEAAFAPVQHLLRVHIADRDPAQELSVPTAFLRLFELAKNRFVASSLLALLEEDSIARRFSIARSQLGSVRDFVERTRIRWGLDGAQKARDLSLPLEDANTWRQGLERLALGVATGPLDETVLGLLPMGDDTMGRAALLANFLAFYGAVTAACDALAHERTLADWATCFDGICEQLFDAALPDEEQGLQYLRAAARRLRELDPIVAGHKPVSMSSTAIRQWLQDELSSKGDSRGFLSGQVTVAALRPMRAIPMRVIAICALHDGSFPRSQSRHEFDLLQHERRPGDRNRRDDDRQMFLDAILAAKDRLVLTWVGRSSKDNSECAPSTVLSELLDHLDQAFLPAADFDSVRAQVHVDHPLQSFSSRYGGTDPRLFTYSTRKAASGQPSTATARHATAAADRPSSEAPTRIELDDLVAFWRHPQRDYCRRVLDVHFVNREDAVDECEPFEVHRLDSFQLLQRAVERRLAGTTGSSLGPAPRATGMLPPGPLGQLVLGELDQKADQFADRVGKSHGTGRARIEIRGSGFVVHGELDGLRRDAMVLWRPGSWAKEHALRAYLLHVLLSCAAAALDTLPVGTHLLGLDGQHHLAPLSDPHTRLEHLVLGYFAGQSAPLPCPPQASLAFATALLDEDKRSPQAALALARLAYEPDADRPFGHDLPDPAIELCFRGYDPLATPEFADWVERVHLEALRTVGTVRAW